MDTGLCEGPPAKKCCNVVCIQEYHNGLGRPPTGIARNTCEKLTEEECNCDSQWTDSVYANANHLCTSRFGDGSQCLVTLVSAEFAECKQKEGKLHPTCTYEGGICGHLSTVQSLDMLGLISDVNDNGRINTASLENIESMSEHDSENFVDTFDRDIIRIYESFGLDCKEYKMDTERIDGNIVGGWCAEIIIDMSDKKTDCTLLVYGPTAGHIVQIKDASIEGFGANPTLEEIENNAYCTITSLDSADQGVYGGGIPYSAGTESWKISPTDPHSSEVEIDGIYNDFDHASAICCSMPDALN